MLKDLDSGLEGRHVIIVEDIVDTGLTLTYLQEILRARAPQTLRTACLLSKPSRRVGRRHGRVHRLHYRGQVRRRLRPRLCGEVSQPREHCGARRELRNLEAFRDHHRGGRADARSRLDRRAGRRRPRHAAGAGHARGAAGDGRSRGGGRSGACRRTWRRSRTSDGWRSAATTRASRSSARSCRTCAAEAWRSPTLAPTTRSRSTIRTSPPLSARSVARGEADAGIVIDGAGIGSAIAANKVRGVRAAMCPDETIARYSREHNGANVLTLGSSLLRRTGGGDPHRGDLARHRHAGGALHPTAAEGPALGGPIRAR